MHIQKQLFHSDLSQDFPRKVTHWVIPGYSGINRDLLGPQLGCQFTDESIKYQAISVINQTNNQTWIIIHIILMTIDQHTLGGDANYWPTRNQRICCDWKRGDTGNGKRGFAWSMQTGWFERMLATVASSSTVLLAIWNSRFGPLLVQKFKSLDNK